MPTKHTQRKASRLRRQGKSPSTQAVTGALRCEPRSSVSKQALARQARSAARRRTRRSRSRAAKQAARTRQRKRLE